MNWITLFDVIWLVSLLGLLFLIWRSSERRTTQDKARDATTFGALIAVSQSNAESAHKAVQVAQEAIDLLKAEKEQPPDAVL